MNKSNCNISVIIPTYNRLSTLKMVINSYIKQPQVKEIIIINDCSTDSTLDFLKNLSKIESKVKYIHNTINMGGTYSKNRAFLLATGAYIFIGEDDLELPVGYFDKLLEHMEESDADIVAGRRLWLQKHESKSQALIRHNKSSGWPFDKYLLITYCGIKLKDDVELPLVDASMLIRKNVVKDVQYDNYYAKTAWREETDFQLMALERGYKIIFCPHVYSFHLFKEKNTGGNHSHSIFVYELTIFRNNMYMARKYWKFLQDKFGLNYLFYLRFILYRLSKLAISELEKARTILSSAMS